MTSGIDNLALTTRLTKKLLLEKVFEGKKNTFINRKRKRQLIKFIEDTVKNPMAFSNDEQFIIYCLLRLWASGRVLNMDFKSAWEKYRFRSLIGYKVWYYNHISEKQQQTIVV